MAKVMIVTGASRGIGAAIALLAAARGYFVCVNSFHNPAAAEEVIATIAGSGGRAIGVRADVSTRAGARDLFAQANERLGMPSVLVNNAGIVGGLCAIEDIDEPRLHLVFETNVFSAFYCSSEAARRMSRRHGGEGGAIVNISSAAARHGGMANEVHYAASKGAIDSLTVALAKEVAGEGIRVNAVRPGVIQTEMHEVHGGQKSIDEVARTIPVGRAGSAEEVAEAVLWLASDHASYVHGAILDVAGGR